MNKLVIALAAIGALAFGVYFIPSPHPADDTRLPASASATPIRDEPVQAAAIESQATAPRREPDQHPDPLHVPSSTARSAQTKPPPQDEEQQMTACSARWASLRAGELAARDAETKDPAWAYAMEQKLREWGTVRLQRASIELIAVDCKTTYCDLVAQPFEPDADNEFSRVLQDATKEPWSDFTGTSFGHSEEAGKVLFRGELRRKRSYATAFEQREDDEQDAACMQLVSQRAQRARAARDAEPRDAAWADQMEQLLRQHITSRLVKNPVQMAIDCRATFCRIRAMGQTEESRTAFQRASEEAAAEPWANLRSGEGGGTGYGDGWIWDVTYYRR